MWDRAVTGDSVPSRSRGRAQQRRESIDLTIAAAPVGGWHVLAVTGELDLYTSGKLREEIREADGSGHIAIDVAEVSFIDSSGLGVMVSSLKHVRELGGTLALVTSEGSPVDRLLQLTGLDRILPVVRSLEDLSTIP